MKAGKAMPRRPLEEISTLIDTTRTQHLRPTLLQMIDALHVRSKSQSLIVVVLTQPIGTLLGQHDQVQLLAEIDAACQTHRCSCVYHLHTQPDLPPVLCAPPITGLIFIGPQTDRLTAQLRTCCLPHLTIDRDTAASINIARAIDHLLQAAHSDPHDQL